MLRIAIISVLIIFIAVVGFQVSLLFREENGLKSELGQLKDKAAFFSRENEDLQSQIDFLSRAENLEKRLKSQFNYKNIGEKMMILVP